MCERSAMRDRLQELRGRLEILHGMADPTMQTMAWAAAETDLLDCSKAADPALAGRCLAHLAFLELEREDAARARHWIARLETLADAGVSVPSLPFLQLRAAARDGGAAPPRFAFNPSREEEDDGRLMFLLCAGAVADSEGDGTARDALWADAEVLVRAVCAGRDVAMCVCSVRHVMGRQGIDVGVAFDEQGVFVSSDATRPEWLCRGCPEPFLAWRSARAHPEGHEAPP